MTAHPLRSARIATCAVFLVSGIGMASWAPMVPYAKARLGLNDASLGLILLALGAGALTTMPLTGVFINRFGSRLTILVATLIFASMMPLLALAANPWLLAAALYVFGMGIGAIDVAMNAQAVIVEQRYGRPIMSFFHGLFSVGGLSGALGMSLLLDRGWNLSACAGGVAALAVVICLSSFSRLLPRREDAPVEGSVLALPHGPVVLVGLLCFICFLAEGAMLDWSAVYLKFFRGFSEADAGIGYAIFSLAMSVGRLTGDRVVHRFGPVPTVRWGALVAAAGYFVAVLVPGGALAGFALVGIGVSNVVPLMFSAAGRIANPAVSLPAITTMGYAGLLAGPALIGFVGHVTSLPVALGLVGFGLLFVAARAKIAAK
jgi:predicted MFS family arabinose efflux permease